MKNKLYVIVFIMILSSLLITGCGKKESVRFQIYQTDYKGTPTTTYPYKLLTNDNVLKIIDKNVSEEKITVEKLEVIYLIKFYDESNEENTLMCMNNGQISLMKHGLKYSEYIVTKDGLEKIIDEIEK